MTKAERSALVASVLAGICAGAQAANWDLEPGFSVAETYSDNIRLCPDSAPCIRGGSAVGADGDFVTEISPEIRLTANGKNFEFDFNYKLQGLFYADDSELDEVLSFGRTSGSAKLIGESLFVDFSGAVGQQIINPAGRIAVSNVSASDNRTQVTRFNVSPYYERALGRTSQIRVAYNFGLVEYDKVQDPLAASASDRLNDSTSNGVSIGISGNPPNSPLSWRLDGSRTRIDYDTSVAELSRDVRLQRIGGEVTWLFSNRVSVFVGGGDEDNEFRRIGGPQKIDGSFWHLGLRGKLDRKTSYEVSAGEQHFGDSLGFSLTREASQLTTNISYLEETTTVGRQQQGYEALFQFLTQITGVELPTPGISVYVRKRLSLDSTLRLAQSRLRVNLYNEDRDYLTPLFGFDNSEGDRFSDGVLGSGLSWTWTALPRTELSVDFGWQRFNLRADPNNPEDTRLQMRLQRELANGFTANVRLWRNVRAATVASNEYEENAVSIGISKYF